MSESRGMGREAVVYTLGLAVTAVLGFASVYVFSRMLTPHEYGIYWMLLSGVELASLVGGAWINQTAKRYYPALAQSDIPGFMGRIAGAYILTGIVMLCAAIAGTMVCLACGWPASLPWLILCATAPYAGLNFVQWQFRIQRRPGGWLVTQLTMMAGRLLFGWLALVYIQRSGGVLLLAFAVASLLALLWGLVRLHEPCCISRQCLCWRSIRGLLDYGLPLTLVNGGGWLINSAGRLILGWMVGEAAVGIYATAQQLALQIVQLPVTPLITAADPLTVHVYEREGKSETARYLRDLMGLVLVLSAGISLSLYLLRVPVAQVLLDHKYWGGAELMGLLAPAMIGWLLLAVLTKSHELTGKTGELSWYMLGAGGLNVVLSLALIPSMHEWGVSLALLLTYIALCLACYLGGRRHLAWPLPSRILLPIAAATLALIGLDALLPAPQGLLWTALTGIAYAVFFKLVVLGTMLLLRPWFNDEAAFARHIFELRHAVKCSEPLCPEEPLDIDS